jgi:DNA ligase-associated metallophosphoesterase
VLNNSYKSINLNGEELILLPQKAIYWPSQKALILGDLHLGKVSHFRKNGIALSENAQFKSLEILKSLIESINPNRLIFLGDLFHSSANSEWVSFENFILSFPKIKFELILGNHDIIKKESFENIKIELSKEKEIGPFLLSHEPKESKNYYVLSGHIHPGVRLNGKGKQRLLLPCFHFGKQQGLLPAFGTLTGLAQIKVKKEDQVFIIANQEVVAI